MNAGELHQLLTLRHPNPAWVDLPVSLLASLGDSFQLVTHVANHRGAQVSYSVLIQGLASQFAVIRKHIAFTFHTGEGEPYACSAAMRDDVAFNKRLMVLRTAGDALPVNHPLAAFAPWKIRLKDGGPFTAMRWNDVFRVVHDVLGHCAYRYTFSPLGELNAFQAHAATFTDEALPALAAETLYQTAWVNFGPHMRRGDGSFPTLGDSDFIPYRQRQYAKQKAFAPMMWEFDGAFNGGLTQ